MMGRGWRIGAIRRRGVLVLKLISGNDLEFRISLR
jgi:hypothetical protein